MDSPRPTRTKEQVVREFRTGEILTAARTVIAEIGYAEASMEQIAQQAGVSKGTLYRYFENKETLLARAFERALDELMDRVRASTQRVRDATDKVREIVRTGLEHTAENQALFEAIREHSPLGPEGSPLFSQRLHQQVESYLELVAQILKRGMRTGHFRQINPRRAARCLVELVRGSMIERLSDPDPPSVDEETETIVHFFLHGIRSGESK